SKHYNKILSAHDNHETLSRLSSADKISLNLYQKNTYKWQLITLPTSVSHRHSKLTGKIRKYHYQRYASLPHATAALFARHSSLTALTSIPDYSIPSYTLPHKKRAGSSWRVRIAAPHIPHVLYVFIYFLHFIIY
ncbi:hypothetical protein, partial [Muribaculum intestinale]|uniref:hypothetical protein n=1 Tax=Muribaculum intestinale TaxID=1796646 RepID=UPI0025B3A259